MTVNSVDLQELEQVVAPAAVTSHTIQTLVASFTESDQDQPGAYVPANPEVWDGSDNMPLLEGDSVSHSAAIDMIADSLKVAQVPVAAAYTPDVLGDWPVHPTTIAEALDFLAARLNVLEP